jgi:hypothetical protein
MQYLQKRQRSTILWTVIQIFGILRKGRAQTTDRFLAASLVDDDGAVMKIGSSKGILSLVLSDDSCSTIFPV